ncbi:MAG TPA: type I methionyl aminopeptidase [Planctomycetota bacterium]|jgi:methionyl aminopeptidase|nr:type I methionyl aminopeptidase [Planctomycetota bacterium]
MKSAPILKEAWEIEVMREAGRIAAEALAEAVEAVRPGATTLDVDRVAEKHIRSRGAVPTFVGYPPQAGKYAFKHTICASVNEEIVHGVPSAERVLQEGDILSIDIGATHKGYVGDTAVTVPVGRISPEARRLIDTTREALDAAILVMKPGAKLSHIGAAVEAIARRERYTVVRNYCGHGVGREMHEPPQVPNYVDPAWRLGDLVLKPGLVLAIEPMICQGSADNRTQPDRWTVVTSDGKLAAHFEHTIAVTESGNQVLTLP